MIEEKKYNDSFQLSNIQLEIHPGETTLLLGHNGSGKTTIIKSLFGLTPYKGRFLLDNQVIEYKHKHSIDEIKQNISFISDDPSLFYFLTPMEYLNLQKSSLNKKRDEHYLAILLSLFQFEQYMNVPMENLSYGNKKKIQIIAQLARKPKYIIIDEPTNGLDPDMVIILKKLLLKLKENGMGMLLSTHNLRFGEELMDRVMILKDGCLLLNMKKSEIIKTYHTSNMEQIYKSVNAHYYEAVEEIIDEINI